MGYEHLNDLTPGTKIVEETREVCTLCAGRRVEQTLSGGGITCRLCGGSGQVITRIVTSTVPSIDIDRLANAVADRLGKRCLSGSGTYSRLVRSVMR